MERRDVALAIGIGLLLGGAVAVSNDYQAVGPIGFVVGVAYRFWYLGVAAVLLALVLGSRGLSAAASRVIGFAGMLWLAFLVGGPLINFVGRLIATPQGA